MKKILKILKFAFIAIIAVIILILLTRVIIQAKIKNDHKITTENGIDEEVIVEIGDIDQYLYIRGQDQDNPIILFLHGGPGSPMTPIIYGYQDLLEDEYTIVNWDQRNSGKTYYLNNAEKVYNTLSMDRMVEDIREIISYLSNRFGQEKVVIMGHSWGSALGTEFIKEYPELVSAYIGVGQVINSEEGDVFAYNATKDAIKESENKEDLETLENLNGYLVTDEDFSLKSFSTFRGLMSKYLNPISDRTTQMIIFSPYYSLKEISSFLKNPFELQKPLMDYLVYDFDARDLVNEYQVPIYYILGEYDWVTPYENAQEYFETIVAPKKKSIVIENAGHMTMIDNPEEFSNAVKLVLQGDR
ncbi:alpha/beta hydrolase [Tissierella sp.]|uniref:alpha/beta fold hydrolase n=1 Tax=Tissierella sp. TaxID=41274 RepID=UPI0028634751|nr:alpha/beta hydrolase [Tissierella sp.]MDR7855128.1 alpha/beta hydrolase [Tissierella sp.]